MNIERRLSKLEAAVGAYIGIPDELSETFARMFDPSPDEEREATIEILSTMPEEFQRLVIEDAELFFDSPDAVDFSHPLTRRAAELVELRLYKCPRPLALPEEFCRAYAELEPGQWLRTWADDCEDCLLAHPVLFWREGRQEKYRRIFNGCVMCGGKLGWQFLSPVSRPCHDSVGSEYRLAMAHMPLAHMPLDFE